LLSHTGYGNCFTHKCHVYEYRKHCLQLIICKNLSIHNYFAFFEFSQHCAWVVCTIRNNYYSLHLSMTQCILLFRNEWNSYITCTCLSHCHGHRHKVQHNTFILLWCAAWLCSYWNLCKLIWSCPQTCWYEPLADETINYYCVQIYVAMC